MATIRQVHEGAAKAKALADPTRLSVACELRSTYPESQSVQAVADAIARHQSLVSRHLGHLVASGLVEKNKGVGGTVKCRLSAEGAALVDAVIGH